jgi:hypothetical protein
MKVTRWISSTALLVPLFVLVANTRAAAQQAASAAPQAPAVAGATVPASSASVSSRSALPGPRLSPEFQRAEPTLGRSTSGGSSLAVASGQHTIVISTLVLVLAVIIIVLLVAK